MESTRAMGLCFFLLMCISISNAQFGTYTKLWSAQSLWNSKPVNPVFNSSLVIPTLTNYPSISAGDYSLGVFRGMASDPPMTVYPNSGFIMDQDSYEQMLNITIPRWPSNTVPAKGGDGHCDIVDDVTGIVHSFWQMKVSNGRYTASTYAWSPVGGTGWGDPAHIQAGVRAVGVCPSGGLIRISEASDTNSMFYHALAMSMDKTGLSANPAYIYPATIADSHAAQNTGIFPEGSLMMLPKDYNSTRIASANLRKVVETLKTYGAYVVDQNGATPFVIYVEIGANFKLSNLTWDNDVAAELRRISDSLRMVVSAEKYLDGNGNTLVRDTNPNLLSMRGPSTSWWRLTGDAVARYDTYTQALVYTQPHTKPTNHTNGTKLGYNNVYYAKLQEGKTYTFSVISNASIMLGISVTGTNVTTFNSGVLANGQSIDFIWPVGGVLTLNSHKPVGGPGYVRGKIVMKVTAPVTTAAAASSATTAKPPTTTTTATGSSTGATAASTSATGASTSATGQSTSSTQSSSSSSGVPSASPQSTSGAATTNPDQASTANSVSLVTAVILCCFAFLFL